MEYFDKKTEHFCYVAINLAGILAGVFYVILKKINIDLRQIIPVCFWYRTTGYYCPGCGGTRAWTALLHLHIFKSVCYHPIVLYGTVVGGWFWLSTTLELISKKRFSAMRLKSLYLYLALAIVLIQWLVKNVLVYTMGYSICS